MKVKTPISRILNRRVQEEDEKNMGKRRRESEDEGNVKEQREEKVNLNVPKTTNLEDKSSHVSDLRRCVDALTKHSKRRERQGEGREH